MAKKSKKPKKTWAPKGAPTFEKLMRITKMRSAAEKRFTKIEQEFDRLPSAKKLVDDINKSTSDVENMLSRRQMNANPIYERKIKILTAKNAVSHLHYLKAFKEFAVTKNANHKFLNALDGYIADARKRVEKAKKDER